MQSDLCPCGSNTLYSKCCGPIHLGAADAETAEALMRSRYCAFVKMDSGYLIRSWHESTRPSNLTLDATNWIGLKIKSTHKGLPADLEGWVEFVARYKIDGRAHRLIENSYFKKENGAWFYVSAVES
ncbi:hypothetical protein A3742_26735 [Oleiphilus sp. HI0071]|uniref:YchJ family protein n=1 Tax=Oleiphilus sp. HI0080 TaxID=1822255 RepID=UPI0007C27381|nr:YchJ family protein [Oleiphilus sp. HI0080]KZY60769.1 hypothetical protein A3737_22945 [Oleiphilus sp. HI0065]KZY87116.1 hypothetical protein A3742_04175 [Oleiphilus sp. HI0071]KZY91284.1 hypothetical protein A3744_05365 [Oleiphilus sp. HI0073]KZZ40988.1 hypothetical protein A3758_15970 [Oleiphilus sp. HI0118]KZZ60245.1 hypothetical protein A3760_05060 [Oleiphilus sp. HI0122]KZZ81627.1 hypothetical protein A3767_16015 [Oleiphilus sp. HI0133]